MQNGKILRDTVQNGFEFSVIKKGDYPQNESKIRETGNCVWAGLYRREFLVSNHVRFDETIQVGPEDLLFNIVAYKYADSIVLNPDVYYIWNNRLGYSTSGFYKKGFVITLKKCLDEELELAKKYNNQTVNNGMFQHTLAHTYVYCVYDCLSMTATMSLKSKRKILSMLREHKAFNVKNNYRQMKGEPLFYAGLWMLFKKHIFMTPYIVLHLKHKLSGNI